MNVSASLLAGIKAVFFGAAIGTSLPTLLIFVILVRDLIRDPGETLLVMVMPLGLGMAISAVGLLVIGGPVTWWLSRRGEESWRAYFIAGLIGGVVPVFLVYWLLLEVLLGALIIAAFGALTGGATAHFWWQFARKDAASNDAERLTEVFE